ncbi:MAG: molybdopterin molybdenumtransferase MoeA [Betaproteobacteria bacterium]|nr:molybdopterin molybdenumtransferase MoeA [Betaproteobacteria bacterium]
MTKAAQPLMPLDVAIATILAQVKILEGVDTVDTWDADGRVLAEDVVSEIAVPAMDNTSMDGYAVRSVDATHSGARLRVTQRIPAGSHGTLLQAGEAARIFTGAPIPPGADAVVMQEHVQTDVQLPDQIVLHQSVASGQWIRRAGEDVAKGAVVLSKGTRLQPASLGLAASIGKHRLKVMRKPRVALLSTGNELVMPGAVAPADMKPGAIYNSNRFFLRALLLRSGCDVSDLGIVADQKQATMATLAMASQTHDLIVSSGGVSVGEEDHVKPAVEALGVLNVWQIAMKPGKPLAFGWLNAAGEPDPHKTCYFMGLPGNPVSSFVTYLCVVWPFLSALQGMAPSASPAYVLPVHFDWPRPDKRREFLRVRRNSHGGLDLFPNQSSGVLTSVVWGDGLIDVAPGQVLRHGDMVAYWPFSHGLS